MHLNTKIIATIGLLSGAVLLASMTTVQQQQREEPKLVNIKVLPKGMTYRQVDHLMDGWASSLGVRCTFCHVRNDDTKKMDFANDAKPEKKMAREMFVMASKINKKFFKAKKDSLGMVVESSVNCNTCHHGVSHPEISLGPPRQNGPGVQPPPAANGAAPAQKP